MATILTTQTSIDALFDEAESLEVKGQFAEAENIYTLLIEGDKRLQTSADGNLLKIDFDSLRASACAYNGRGLARRMMRRYDDAEKDYQAAIECVTFPFNLGEDWLISKTFTNLADLSRVAKGDFDSAHHLLDVAFSHARVDSLQQIAAFDQRGLVYVGQENYRAAEMAYNYAEKLCEWLGQKLMSATSRSRVERRHAQVLHHLGAAYVYAEDKEHLSEAYTSQQKALALFEKLGDAAGMTNTVVTLGKLALLDGKHDEALAQYGRAWPLVVGMDYKRGIRTVALHLAEAHLSGKTQGLAIPYLECLRNDEHPLEPADKGPHSAQMGRIADLYVKAGFALSPFMDGLLVRYEIPAKIQNI